MKLDGFIRGYEEQKIAELKRKEEVSAANRERLLKMKNSIFWKRAKELLIEVFEEWDLDEYNYDDLQTAIFTDYYNNSFCFENVEQTLLDYGIFDIIAVIMEYETDIWGGYLTDLSSPISILNTIMFKMGQDIINAMFREIPEVYNGWENEATKELNDLMLEWLKKE